MAARSQVTASQVIRRHARHLDRDHVAHCVPTEAEVKQGFLSLGRAGKVVYDTREWARRAAQALSAVGFGSQVPYECPREDVDGTRHWHLQSLYHAAGG